MPVKIKNLTTGPLWLSFNSGNTLRLSPGQTSGDIPDVEVTNNPKLEKMERQRLIDVHHTEDRAVPAGHADAKPVGAGPAGKSSTEFGAEEAGGPADKSEGVAAVACWQEKRASQLNGDCVIAKG